MFTLKTEPQDSLQVLEQGFSLYKLSFKQALPYSFLAALLMIAPYCLCTMFGMHIGTTGHVPAYLLWILAFAWLGGFTILSGLIFRLYCMCYNVPSHFIGSLQHALSKLIPLLLLSALYSLIILSGTMLMVIPGLILTLSLMFSFVLVITDNQNVFQTLTMSHRLVWGQWWHVARVICVPMLLNIILTLCVLLCLIVTCAKINMPTNSIILSATAFNIVIQTLFIPLIFSIMLVLLHDLRRRAFQNLPRW